ncbi:MAG: replication initiator protein A [Hasllibacter sp.]
MARQSAPGATGGTPGADLPFFVCDFWGALPKVDLAGMEHPMFSLATRPDRRILRYEHAGARVEVIPSVKGLATVHDKDVLIYCVSQLMAAINRDLPTARTLRLTARDLLLATGRETSGDGYRRLREAFERLAGTRVVTDIATGPPGGRLRETTGFGLIESWRIVHAEGGRGGRMDHVTVTLSEWLYRAVLARSVLTLSRDYFALRRPLERRVYEICRKHCGRQPEWRVGLEVLRKKAGSASPVRVFRRMMRDMIGAQPLPGYLLGEEAGDVIRVSPRRVRPAGPALDGPRLSPAALERARMAAPGADVYALEAQWRAFWEETGRPSLRSPDAAFLGWVAKRAG